MDQSKHWSHDHRLILNEKSGDGEELSHCYACQQSISGPSYDCKECLFFLHKSCKELPPQLTHPYHPESPLNLRPNPAYDDHEFICDVCENNCRRFVYHCARCKFDVDINCALVVHGIQEKVEHSGHQHQLITLKKEATFFCDACGSEHKGSSYLCTTCSFWANQQCVSLRTTVKLGDNYHFHSLTLCYIPCEPYASKRYCKICNKPLYRRHWVYGCSTCQYFVHVNCATSEIQDSKSIEQSRYCEANVEDQDQESNLISLPLPDESIDLITQFIKDMKLEGSKETDILNSHKHPLIFLDNQVEDEGFSGSKHPLWRIEARKDEQCYGCQQTISIPFYYCGAQCYFCLHQWCAELPKQLQQHPGHLIHSLQLMNTQGKTTYRCKFCDSRSDMYVYGCEDCEFYLDCKCACLPRTVKHKVHKHPLALRPLGSNCYACELGDSTFGYICEICQYNLCIGCTLLPGTVRHRYDEHPFMLIYCASILDQIDDEYYCEICEEEINSKRWFYHCNDCNQSLHMSCIRPTWWHFDKKENFSSVKIVQHPHWLKLVNKPTFESLCGICGKHYVDDRGEVYQCESCRYWIHIEGD